MNQSPISSQTCWNRRYVADRSFGMMLFHRRVSHPSQIMKRHSHEHIEIVFLAQGEGTFVMGNHKLDARQGDILICNSGFIHECNAMQSSIVEMYAILFHPSMLKSLALEIDDYRIHIQPYMESKRFFPVQIAQDSEYYPDIAHIVKQLIHEYHKQPLGYKINIVTLLKQFCIFAVRASESDPDPDNKENTFRVIEKYQQRFTPLFKYIENGYFEKITIEQAAQTVNMSRYHFCKVFKQLTGRTFIEYVNLYRVIEAERLLKESDLTVTEISDRVGFSSVHYLNRIFKQYKKCSPSSLRK